MKDKLAGAWIGRISGCLLGKPVEYVKSTMLNPLLKGTSNYPMHKYITANVFDDKIKSVLTDWKSRCWADTLNGIAPVDDDTNYTVFTMKLIEEYGLNFCLMMYLRHGYLGYRYFQHAQLIE